MTIKRFNSRTPCGVRPPDGLHPAKTTPFQFTHPVWGATLNSGLDHTRYDKFQFTHPVWGATDRCDRYDLV